MSEVQVGRVAALWRYPVKSMAGEACDGADVSWHGLAGDRRWAFVRPGLERSDFPWLTIRERSDLWSFRPRFAEPTRPDASRTLVLAPDGVEYDVVDPALASVLGEGVRVIKHGRGVFDTAPLSLISTQTVARLGELVGAPLDPRRFRPNVLLDLGGDDAAFAEDEWVGARLRIGALELRIDQRDKRCVMINVDPETSERDARVLRTVARERSACTGLYATPTIPGRVAVGDPVTLALTPTD